MFVYGSNFGPSFKNIVMFDHGINLNNSNIKFQKDSLMMGSFDLGLKNTPIIQNNIVFGYEG
jgi:hypothetical protein